MLWKCCTQHAKKFGKLSSGHWTGKGQFSFQSQRKAMQKNVQTAAQIALITHGSKIMFKIVYGRLQQHVNYKVPHIQFGFRKGRGTRDQIPNIHWIIKKARDYQKKKKKGIYFCFIDYVNTFDCVDHSKLEDSSRVGNTRQPELPLEKFVYRSRSNS